MACAARVWPAPEGTLNNNIVLPAMRSTVTAECDSKMTFGPAVRTRLRLRRIDPPWRCKSGVKQARSLHFETPNNEKPMTQDELFTTIFAIDNHLKHSISTLQNPALFQLRINKLLRLKNIVEQQPFDSGWRLITMKSWEPILSEVEWADFEYMENDFFEDISGDLLQQKMAFLDKAILLTTNYPPHSGGVEKNVTTLRNFNHFYELCKNTLFLGWDWDNHFNLHIGSILAASCDVYFHSHLSNDYELSNFCNHKYRMPASAYQWSRQFLIDNIDLIIRPDRSNDIFGRFRKYGLFAHRNQVVTTLAQQLPGVELTDDLGSYHALDKRGKLEEWTRYKCHWAVPTLQDVSTRVFDILITGGVVIVPERFRGDPVFAELDERDCFYYNDVDIIAPQALAERALASFDRCGIDGVLRRHRHALNHHNLDSRVRTMLDTVRTLLPKAYPAGAPA